MKKSIATRKLRIFLKKAGKTHAQFASELGIGRVSLSRYFSGSRTPDDDMKKLIWKKTQQVVTPNDWCGIIAEDIQ